MSLEMKDNKFLSQLLAQLPFNPPNDLAQQIDLYIQLLNKWNTVHNLTAIRDEQTQITHHFMDCLSVIPYVSTANHIADIGSGAGFPGMVIALTCPRVQVSLLESNGKKAAFLRSLKRTLQLKNVSVINQRVENWQAENRLDVIISRAVSDIDDFLSLTAHLGDQNTQWMLMKANVVNDCHHPAFELKMVETLTPPGLDAARRLVVIQRNRNNDN